MLRSILLFFTKSGTNLAESLVLSRTPAAFDTKGRIRSFRQSLPPLSLYKCRRNLSCSFSSIVIFPFLSIYFICIVPPCKSSVQVIPIEFPVYKSMTAASLFLGTAAVSQQLYLFYIKRNIFASASATTATSRIRTGFCGFFTLMSRIKSSPTMITAICITIRKYSPQYLLIR